MNAKQRTRVVVAVLLVVFGLLAVAVLPSRGDASTESTTAAPDRGAIAEGLGVPDITGPPPWRQFAPAPAGMVDATAGAPAALLPAPPARLLPAVLPPAPLDIK